MYDNVTPIRQQYLEIKKQYPNTILLFRLGDFYETFDHDAEIASQELDLVLTSRPVAKGLRVPMAGIPYHAIENYLSRLIEKGYHVAICEQVGEQPTRGLFAREVVRVVTPGTVIEPGLLKGDQNNYLVSLLIRDNRAGIAFADISTGELSATEINNDDLPSAVRAELIRLHPAEVLIPEGLALHEFFQGHFTKLPAWRFELNRCTNVLNEQFSVTTLEGFGLRTLPLAVQAVGALVQYLRETQPQSLDLFQSIHAYSLSEFMTLDASTRRNLELTETIRQGDNKGSLLNMIDRTVSPMGKRLMRQWVSKPLLDLEMINQRQERITFLIQQGVLRAELRRSLRFITDLERLIIRIITGHALPRDLVQLRESLRGLTPFKVLFQVHPSPLDALLDEINPCNEELALLETAISNDPPATLQNIGTIRLGYSAELDHVIETSSHARDWIANLENIERERTGIRSLKVGFNKVFGYYIEITHSNTANLPGEYIRKQTLVNAERYITPEMKEYESLVLNAEERIREIEIRLFKQICAQIINNKQAILSTARAIAELDTLSALAETAAIHNYCRPVVNNTAVIAIHDGRHPVVEQTLSGDRFVPNDSIFTDGEIVRVITGPNMSGKSTFLRQVALIVLMAQIGSFVPAASAEIGIVDRIFTRIGAQDEIHAGQSTFMVEMVEMANILNHATSRSLLVLDEIGRGTSTYDGLSIAWAVIEYIHNHPRLRCRTLFATHYHELVQLSEVLPGVHNYNVAVSEADAKVVFLHKIVSGGTDRSYGIHVAQLAGLPRPVIQRASEILVQLEATSGSAIHLDPSAPQQMALFPETNPLLEELRALDMNTLSPIEAINKLYEWQRRFFDSNKGIAKK